MPSLAEDWFNVDTDAVLCSSEEEEDATAVANMFRKATTSQPQRSTQTTRVKRVGPTAKQGLMLSSWISYFPVYIILQYIYI